MRTTHSKTTLALLFLLGLVVCGEAFAAERVQILTFTNTAWRYRSNTVDPAYSPADAWVANSFDDSSWSGPGVGLFGRETTPATYAPYAFNSPIAAPSQNSALVSSYFRVRFNWTHAVSNGIIMSFTNFIDDGLLVYLNGVELFSYNMPATRPVPWNVSTLPNGANPAPTPEGTAWVTNVVANLRPGENVIAAQLQQHGSSSSDVVLGIAMAAEIPTPISITSQPSSVNVVQSRPATFTVGTAGSTPRFQWYRDGSPIPGANAATYTIYPTLLSDHNATFHVVVSNAVNSVTSDTVTLQITPDTVPPGIAGVSSVLATEIGVLFDELMNSNTVFETFAYSINGGPAGGGITNVVVRPNGMGVTLQLEAPVASPFTVGVVDVQDYAGNAIAMGTMANGSQWASSGDIGLPTPAGSTFSGETGDVDITAGGADIWGNADQFHFVYNQRSGDFDVKVKVQRLDASNAWAKGGLMARETLDGPSATIHAYTTPDRPPGTRTYEAGRRPTSGTATVEWGTRPGSGLPNAWVRLRRNGDIFRAYHGTNGTDWLPLAGPVTQVLPSDVFVGPACTSHNVSQSTVGEFRDFGNVTYPGATLAINPQPASQTVQTHQTVTFTGGAVATGAPAGEVHYQWQRSPDGTTWTNIPGANGTSVTIQFPAGDDDGDAFRLVASIPGVTATSAAATLTLTTDTTAPRIQAVVGISQTRVLVFFSEPMGEATADPFSYAIDQGINVANATFAPNNRRRVDIDIDPFTPLTFGSTYTLTSRADDLGGGVFSGVQDPTGNPVNPNPTMSQFRAQNYPGDPNTLRQVPTNTKRPLGSLTQRGFDGRMVQISAPIANNNENAELMLAGQYINPATGQPYPNLAPLPTFVETNSINYGDNPTGAGTGRLLPDRAFPGYVGVADNMAMEILCYLELRGGIYRMGVNSDDGFRVTPARGVSDPNNSIVLGEFNGGRGPADTTFDFIVTEDGLYPFRLIWEEGQGGATCEWWIQSLTDNSYIPVNAEAIKAFRAVIPPPRITLTRSGANQITLSWTDADGAFQLEESSSLSPPDWDDLNGATGVGGNYSIDITVPATGQRYYRLRPR